MYLSRLGPSVLALGALLGATAPASAGLNMNALTLNGLTLNAVVGNGLMSNALLANALTSNALTNNAVVASGSAVDELNGVVVEGVAPPDQPVR
jgi:hypothetical protein